MNHVALDLKDSLPSSESLFAEQALKLYLSPDIFTLGELAGAVRERWHGRKAYYNINRHINYSNYCVLRCKFCSFYRPFPKTVEPASSGGGVDDDLLEAGGYELSLDEIVALAKSAYARGATEVHIVGGLHPRLPFSYYTDLCSAIRSACPHMHIKAFTAIEIIHFTRISHPQRSHPQRSYPQRSCARMTIAEVLTELRDAGLGSMPGGGAEIFDSRVHDEAFKTKVGESEWFEVHRIAHELGIFTNATMLYGHVENKAERITHLMKLRQAQAESLRNRPAHFNTVIPLSFIPDGSALSHLPGPTGLDDLRTLAISRIICDNIPHIKAFWIMLTPKLAQVALNWGVDDIDGTVVYYDITKRNGQSATHQELTVENLKRLITQAGCIPVERDTLYRRVIRNEGTWRVQGEPWSVTYDPTNC